MLVAPALRTARRRHPLQEELRESLAGLDASGKLHLLYQELAVASKLAIGQPFVQVWLKWLQSYTLELREHWAR